MAGGGAQKPNTSLVSRLVRTAVFWTLPSLIITAVALSWFYRNSAYRLFDDDQTNTILALIAAVEPPAAQNPGEVPENLVLSREPIDPRYQRALSGHYWIVGLAGKDGTIKNLASSYSMSGETITMQPSDARQLLENPGSEIHLQAAGPDVDQNEKLRLNARSVILPGMNSQPVIFMAGGDIRPTQRNVQSFAVFALGLMILLSIALVTAVYMQVRLGLKPLFDLQDRVVEVREGRSDRVEGTYPSEIDPLAQELNTLIDHNRDVVERARTHVSNLAHALKTPLAVLQNESQSSRSSLAATVQRQIATMRTHVDHHLNRARAAARGQIIGVVTPVEETVKTLVRTLERIYRDRHLDFSLDIQEELAFRGEKRDLEEMMGNLLDNASKWSAGKVYITGRDASGDENMLELSFEDNGPGLEPEQYAEALKRGQRLDESTPGTGFGLSIVSDLAEAYNGDVVLGRSDLGGLKVTLILPRRI